MKISDEQKIFLIKNYENNSIEQLNDLFFKKYGKKIHKTELAKTCRKIGLKRGQGAPGRKRDYGKRKYPMQEEKNNFIHENIHILSRRELIDSFKDKFGTEITDNAVMNRISRLGYGKIKGFNYTQEHDCFLIENFSFFTYEELKKEFDRTFEVDISINSLSHHCLKKLNLRKCNRYLIGQELKRDKRVMVKIHNEKGYYNYKDKSRLCYENKNGKIPKGYVVVCLDGNKNNCDDDNLVAISRRELSVLAGSKWMGTERNNMQEKIKYAQLKCLLKESEEQ